DRRRIFQPRRIFSAGARAVRRFTTQHHYRSGRAPAEWLVPARRPPRRDEIAHAPGQREQSAQHGPVGGGRYEHQLADVRPRPVRPADADHHGDGKGAVLDMTRPQKWFLVAWAGPTTFAKATV